jgi:hypothetical protein
MVEIISIVILALSLAGLVVVLWKKLPALAKLPEPEINFQELVAQELKEGIKKIPVVKKFSYELYLQKLLSKVRVLTMKTENKTGNWLEILRKRTNKNNSVDEGKNQYWDELKKAKNGK